MMNRIILLFMIILGNVFFTRAQPDNGILRMNDFRNPKKRQIIQIPDVSEFQVLVCDFHTHTVFSDGNVWPTVRVQEAWQEGLDVLSITDHIEYTPHAEDVKVNHNRAWELAKNAAAENNLVFVKGTEITRNTPPGHFNAIFIGDASEFVEDRSNEKDKEAVMKGVEQDAFIFWNHPGWQVNNIEGSYEWIDLVDELNKEKNLDGIEVINGFGIHLKALDWCIDHDLTVMGSSDIHNLVKHDYSPEEFVHRATTLVFARERTAEAVREALDAGRTVAWASKYLAGKEEHLSNLFHACVDIGPSFYKKGDQLYYELKNNSDLFFDLELKSGNGTARVTLHPRSAQVITAQEGQQRLTFEVVTAFVRSDRQLSVEIPLP